MSVGRRASASWAAMSLSRREGGVQACEDLRTSISRPWQCPRVCAIGLGWPWKMVPCGSPSWHGGGSKLPARIRQPGAWGEREGVVLLRARCPLRFCYRWLVTDGSDRVPQRVPSWIPLFARSSQTPPVAEPARRAPRPALAVRRRQQPKGDATASNVPTVSRVDAQRSR
jgi:hypothetical protein